MPNQQSQVTPTPLSDITLYDIGGTPIAVIDTNHQRGFIIFLAIRPYAGKPVAQISRSSIVYGLNGNQIGVYKKEIFYNSDNTAIGFTANTFKGNPKPGPVNFSKFGVPKDYAPNAPGFEREPENPSQNDSSLLEVLKSGSIGKL